MAAIYRTLLDENRRRRFPGSQAAGRPHAGPEALDRVAHLGHGLNRVAVVGAGWAGLAAAVTPSPSVAFPSRYSRPRAAWGAARAAVSIDGVDLDNGQHVLIGAYRECLRLMRLVGADPERLLVRLAFELRYADGFHLRAPRLP